MSVNLSVDKVYNAKNIFLIATLYRKIGRKNTFDFGGLYMARNIYYQTIFEHISIEITKHLQN
jgi:hypothetical protein